MKPRNFGHSREDFQKQRESKKEENLENNQEQEQGKSESITPLGKLLDILADAGKKEIKDTAKEEVKEAIKEELVNQITRGGL